MRPLLSLQLQIALATLNLIYAVTCINIYVNGRTYVANCLEKRWRERNRVNSCVGQPEEAHAELDRLHSWKPDQPPHFSLVASQETERRINLRFKEMLVNWRHRDL
ncbi:hypothetical protein R69927_05542 [Paraburkholderia domus]|jgi:hypothetical protein|uniref:Uncharacterized protein n=1 Tax=Paraburkholderia domus TaxID=2793075 RepID=A0A9N8NDK6_9BURK|nr:hypothetical protein R70006_06406 [Paraburkholderia domus]CAE6869333.1 hypothetical protein R69749_06043 [Paraburkholderia domus]CAE6903732.1 hypothetical protein R69927_05542 [Paraburkholderia domus]CAE6961522.1 hypothetical protein R70211_06989 [Paraburkholderia domus]CAE6967863.1 hypothetical protein R70199_07888 [Paraburkholderia domus]